MHVVLITPEITPYSRSGSVGDVSAALPKALRGLGHKVTVISPLWSSVDPNARSLARRLSVLEAELGGRRIECALYDGRTTGGVELLFITHEGLFGGTTAPAGDPGGAAIEAALVFAQAAVAQAATIEPDVLHAHGWFGAPALAVARRELGATPRVLSLHDALAEGRLSSDEISAIGAPAVLAEAIAEGGGSLLGAGIASAQRVIASSQFAADALVARQAPASASGKLCGIADGLDSARWNPLTDPALPARFDPVERAGKARCKDAAQYAHGLEIDPDVPLLLSFGLPQGDGVDARAISEAVLHNEVQLVVVEPGAARELLGSLAEAHRGQLATIDAIDDATEHRLVAAADLVLVHRVDPARADLHLRAQRYGAVPIVLRAEAMADTIVDCDAALETGSGFVFDELTTDDVIAAVRRALAAFELDSPFEALQKRVMQLDVSWDRSARRYEHLYKSLPQSE